MSYRARTWLIDECQIAFFMSCLMIRVWTHLFCCYFQCHLSYHQQFVWYPGYHGYQFCGPLYVKDIMETKTNKKLHLPGTGTKQSEDIRQSSLFEKLHQLEGSVQEVFFSIKQASIPSYSTVDKNYLNGTPSP